MRSLGGDRVSEVLELMEEIEETVCVSFHLITFGPGDGGGLGRGQKRLIAPSALIHTPKVHGQKVEGLPQRGYWVPAWVTVT